MTTQSIVKSRKAFTVLEILTVFAIISILTALLISTVGSAGAHSRKITCLNNLRQIGVAMELYKTDTKYYPMTYWYGAYNYQTLLAPYLRTVAVNYGFGEFRLHHKYRCPEIYRQCQKNSPWGGPPYPNHWGYAYNETINRDIYYGAEPLSRPMKVWSAYYVEGYADALVPRPSKKIAMVCNANGNKWYYFTWDIFKWDYPLTGWGLYPPHGIHRGTENYLFCDGRVESISPTEQARVNAGWYADMKGGPYKTFY